MKKIRRPLTVILTFLICFAFVPVAFAHPLGNFTINQYAGLHISQEAVVIDYVLDMAEIPAFQEIALFDANGNGQPDSGEAAAYHADKCTSLQPNLTLLLNQKAVTFSLISSSIEFPAGVGGLTTLRLTCQFQAPINIEDNAVALSFQNTAFPDRLGWKEIVLIPDGITLKGDFSSTSPSNRLTSYPQDLLSSPLQQREVNVEISSIGVPAQSQSSGPVGQGSSSPRRDDAFTRLILLQDITLPTLLLALAISFIWGALHAMTPGHGKTIVGAYLVGSRGTLRHALYLGLTTTITHTLGVFALGLITLFAAQYVVPETLYPWRSLLSGLFVVGIGINLFLDRFKTSGITLASLKADLAKRSHPVSAHQGEGRLSPVFEHIHAERNLAGPSHKYVLSHSYGDTHRYDHEHGEHLHIHDHGQPHVHRHNDYNQDHDHGVGGHSHMPPEEITWRSLLALGVSGGLIPCPSALVVLLGAIALNKIGFGLILVLAFSLGLAGALTAIGILFIYAGRLFERFPAQGQLIRLLPALSALFVSAIGAALSWKALGEMGII